MATVEATNNVPKKKERSADKCREWEKVRRNRFNNAISELGLLIKQAIENIHNEEPQSQFPKIEIVQKAIIFIKDYVKEIAQLKSQIVALEAKLESEIKQKENKKDASTQIYKKTTKTKLKAPKKPVIKTITSKNTIPDANIKTSKLEEIRSENINQKNDNVVTTTTKSVLPNILPNILPKPTFNRKDQSENTFFVLPAPYVLPPRPILFPAAHPTFFLLDPNIQPNNCKHSIQTLKRTQNENTKTTMVNILPISAYSHPLSLGKHKKTVTKSKPSSKVKPIKRNKINKKTTQPVKSNEISQSTKTENNKELLQNNKTEEKDVVEPTKIVLTEPVSSKSTELEEIRNVTKNNIIQKDTTNINSTISERNNTGTSANTSDNEIIIQKTQSICKDTVTITDNNKKFPISNETINLTPVSKTCETKTKEKSKDKDKLPAILDSELCESTVEAGNARLELAEELLAASPTAAFLMSFPLVSGNRADSPADESNIPSQSTTSTPPVPQKRNVETSQSVYYTKSEQIDVKTKGNIKSQSQSNNNSKTQEKTNHSITSKQSIPREIPITTASIEYPFVSLSGSTVVPSSCSAADMPFALDFDCNLTKSSISNYNSSYVSNNNLFYNKNDPFNSVKNTIYSSSNISSGHDYNSLSLYPCAVEKYASKNKSDYSNVEDNLMKINSSRLTYDIDLGWPHKSFDFVTCATTSNTFNKDVIFTTSSAPFTSFNTDFHVNLGTNKKESLTKTSSAYTDTLTNLYSQTTNFWQDDFHFYGNNSSAKSIMSKQQIITSADHLPPTQSKPNTINHFDSKINCNISEPKTSQIVQQLPDKYSKKSPSKLHINWMTSETRSVIPHNNSTTTVSSIKESSKSYGQPSHAHLPKKQENNDPNYFPIQINNLPSQLPSEEFQVWPSARPLGTTEISIDPPPINLPTLVGDLALGPHDKKKNDSGNKLSVPNADLPNYNSFLSVTQLMNRPNEIPIRYMGINGEEALKSLPSKQHINNYSNDNTRKGSVRFDTNYVQPYVFEDKINNLESVNQYANNKTKLNKTPEKHSKSHKNNYSAEALIRSGSQKAETSKFITPSQKYNNFNATHDASMAQVSHFPPIIDYTDNGYGTQQLGSSNLYNSTSNTMSNSFYTNFMPTSSNLMTGNYSGGNFSGDFIDYNQGVDCNYANQRYEEFKMRNNPSAFTHDKVPVTNYRNSRRESATKHKLDCSKKESSKKYPSKKTKVTTENEEWSDTNHFIWHNRTNKKHGNLVSEEIFPNYPSSQVPGQYQSEFFNSHLMPANVQGVMHNADRSVPSFPATSRANFNLSTIFPEITMKVQ